MPSPAHWRFLTALVALVALAGCSGKTGLDPAEIDRLRTQLTLADEPDGAETIIDLRAAMLGEERPDLHAMLAHDHGDEHEDGDDEHADEHANAEHADHAEHADEEHGHEHAHAAVVEAGPRDVVLVGVVGGIPNPSPQSWPEFPFDSGAAVVFIADPEAAAAVEEEGHHHAPGEECAFCLANAADASALIAAVRFVGENGEPLPVDVRTLFDLKERETVVIRGKATAKTGSILMVEATGLYVRR